MRPLHYVLPLLLFSIITGQHAWGKSPYSEKALNKLYCDSIGGQTETKHDYHFPNGAQHYVLIDCETDNEVIEAGLDRYSSLDCVQQVLFFHQLTGKKPVIVIYDSDGMMGQYEYRLKTSIRSISMIDLKIIKI